MATPVLPEITILNSKAKTLRIVGILALVVGAIYAFLLYRYLNPEHEYARRSSKLIFVIWFCGPVYVIMLFLGLRKVFNPKPAIRINSQHIWWVVFNSEDMVIPWEQVVKFELNKSGFGGNVRVFVRNPELFFSAKFAERQGQEKFVEKHGTHISISPELADVTLDELFSTLQNYHDVINGKPGAKIMPRFS